MKLSHITIHVPDKAAEIEFYKAYAGLDVIRAFGNITFLGNSEAGETLVEIIEDKENAFTGSNISMGFTVEDAAAYREKLASAGLNPTPVISPNPAVSFFFVKDPVGFTVQFIEG